MGGEGYDKLKTELDGHLMVSLYEGEADLNDYFEPEHEKEKERFKNELKYEIRKEKVTSSLITHVLLQLFLLFRKTP